MKKLMIALLLATISSSTWAQMSNMQWQKCLGGSGGDEGSIIIQTLDGGYIVNGQSNSTDGQVTGNHGAIDYWVAKLNDTGGIQWEISLGGSFADEGNAIQQTFDGGYIVGGGIESSDGDVDSSCNVVEWDYWLVKLSSSGSIVWSNCFGGSSFNVIYSLQQTTDSNYIVAGTSYSDDGEITGHHGDSTSTADYWVIKVSSTGSLLWEKSLGGSQNELAKSIQQTSDGGYIVAGASNSTDGEVTGNHGQYDFWVVKLDDTGGIQWQKSLGGSSSDNGEAIQQTFDGGYIVAGNSNSNDGQVTGHHGDSTTYDFWVVKLDDTGAIQWEESLGGSGDDNAYSVQQTLDSGYIVSGSTTSTDGDVTVNYGEQDYWVVKLNKYGTIQWQKSLGGSQNDASAFIRQTSDSGYVTTGVTYSDDGNVSGNHGYYDYWVVKLSACLLDSPVIVQTDSLLSTSGTYIFYQWDFNGVPIPGATNATYTATANGTYNLSITDTNTCKGVSNAINITNLGVNTVFNSSVITIMPNPTTGTINIKGAGMVNISVYDVLGQIVKYAENTDKISISELPTGLYFVRLSDDNGEIIYQDKVIKQ